MAPSTFGMAGAGLDHEVVPFAQQHHDTELAVSEAEYRPQNYGFAMPLSSDLGHTMNVILLRLQESGRVARIVRAWLGESGGEN